MGAGDPRVRVGVVGGSLGGLNCANWLRDAGCEVVVYERSTSPLRARGAGIVLNPATVRYLTERDMSVERVSAAATSFRYLGRDGVAHEEPCALRFASYNALYQAFLECFGGGAYHLAARCVGLDMDDEGATLHFEDRAPERHDLVVFADGVRSIGRELLAPDARPRYPGYVAWRGAVAAADLPPDARELLEEAITYTILPDGHLLAYPIFAGEGADDRGARLMNWLWYQNVPAGPALDALLTSRTGERLSASVPPGFVGEDHIRRLRDEAAERLHPALVAAIARTAEPFIQVIIDVDVPAAAFGRACLVGDAAFVLRPHVAAGTAKAAEDGWALAQAIAETDGDVHAALSVWEPRQMALGRDLASRTRNAGRRLQNGTWPVGAPLAFGLYEAGDSAMDVATDR